MSKITDLFDYLKQCPQLTDLWLITTEEEKGKRVILPSGSSAIYTMQNERVDVIGNYNGTAMPYPSIYEDYQVNMFQPADPRDNSEGMFNINALSQQDVEKVCEWILQQNYQRNLPYFNGLRVITIEPTGINNRVLAYGERDETIVYAITVRVRYVNPNKRIEVEYDEADY